MRGSTGCRRRGASGSSCCCCRSAAWFELYDLFFTAYVGPGLVRSGLFSSTTTSFFGISGLASFVAATFAGLFIGTHGLRLRRRPLRPALDLHLLAAVVHRGDGRSWRSRPPATAINLWRLIAGIGIGVELVTIDTYIAELMPKDMRGRAFAFNQSVQFSVVPVVAFLAWYLVPLSPLGFDGWRWVVLIGAFGAVCVWFIRLGVPESPRWLAQRGRIVEAEKIVARLEAKIAPSTASPCRRCRRRSARRAAPVLPRSSARDTARARSC